MDISGRKKYLYRIAGLRHNYGERTVLDIDELNILAGTSTGLAGPNGCGKSTLLNIMAFIMPPGNGKIFFNEKKIAGDTALLRKKVTILLQSPYLLKRNVYENIAYGLKVRDIRDRVRDRVYGSLEAVGLDPPEFSRRNWNELSGGEAQRVALASRLVLRPEVLLLDEPTAGVDMASAGLIIKAVLDYREKYDTSIIIASHDSAWLEEATDSVSRMNSGKIVR